VQRGISWSWPKVTTLSLDQTAPELEEIDPECSEWSIRPKILTTSSRSLVLLWQRPESEWRRQSGSMETQVTPFTGEAINDTQIRRLAVSGQLSTAYLPTGLTWLHIWIEQTVICIAGLQFFWCSNAIKASNCISLDWHSTPIGKALLAELTNCRHAIEQMNKHLFMKRYLNIKAIEIRLLRTWTGLRANSEMGLLCSCIWVGPLQWHELKWKAMPIRQSWRQCEAVRDCWQRIGLSEAKQ